MQKNNANALNLNYDHHKKNNANALNLNYDHHQKNNANALNLNYDHHSCIPSLFVVRHRVDLLPQNVHHFLALKD